MICIRVETDIGRKIIGFSVRGHAAYAPHGEDIVCAAVSAITQTAVIGLQKYFAQLLEVNQASGDLSVIIAENLSHREREIADAILNTMYWGLKSMEQDYKKYVKVITKEVQLND